MNKLVCDICNSPLEMNADGQGAVCTSCGMNYSTARLREKLNVKTPAQSVEEEVYDITDFEVIDATEETKHFMLFIEDSFLIKDRGMVVTGYVQEAPVHVGDAVTVVRADGTHFAASVAGIEQYKTLYDKANPGEAVGILLPEIKPGQVAQGDVLTSSANVKPSAADYFHSIYCKRCGTRFNLPTNYAKELPKCPNCNTPLAY